MNSSTKRRRRLPGGPIDPERSMMMSRVGSKNSKPELVVRRLAHSLGYRFRLHRRDLPGTPDVVFPKLKKAIFVHGCFWHRHSGCIRTTTPKTRAAYWADKFKQNIERDATKERQLESLGWEVLVIWECETFHIQPLAAHLRKFLSKEFLF